MRNKEELLVELSDNVAGMDDDAVVSVAHEYVQAGYPALDGITEGLVDGMNRATALYNAGEYYVPELLVCSDAMYKGLEVLRPHLERRTLSEVRKVVIGVVEGDTHDIGKNLVKVMLETGGFEVYDMGRDVPAENFVAKVKEVGADVLALDTLMTTRIGAIGEVIDLLEEEGVRDRVKVIVGGAPVSAALARKLGADGYSETAPEAVDLVNALLAGDASSAE